MTLFQNELIAFRCPKSFKDKITEHAHENGLHLSQFIRKACAREVIHQKDAIVNKPISMDSINNSYIKIPIIGKKEN